MALSALFWYESASIPGARPCPTPDGTGDSGMEKNAKAHQRGTTKATPPQENPGALRQEHDKVLRALRERVKELNCLYSITRLAQREDLSTPDLLRGIATVLKASWQYPETTCVRVAAQGVECRTAPYAHTPWMQAAPIPGYGEDAGLVEVGYLAEHPECEEGPFLAEERSLIDAVGELLGQILRARRTKEQVARLSRELLKAQEKERQRIARDLHDKAAQDLSLLKLEIEGLCHGQGAADQGLTGRLERLAGQVTAIIGEIRNISYALLPPDLEQLGLASAVFRLCEEFSQRTGVPVEYSADGMGTLGLDFETQINLYRIVQEALANIRKHAGASRARVGIIASHPSVRLRIEDDGGGFDPASMSASAANGRSLGLLGMRERAQLLGGTFEVRSLMGKGVRILVQIPVKQG